MRRAQHTGRLRYPPVDVSSNVRSAPEVAREAVERLICGRRRGEVIESDPRTHEAPAVARWQGSVRRGRRDAPADPAAIHPGVCVLSKMADLMRDLEGLVAGKEPLDAPRS